MQDEHGPSDDEVGRAGHTRILLFPFLSVNEELSIGGWDVAPWDHNQDVSLSNEERQRCLQWLEASSSRHSTVCVRSDNAALTPDELCIILEYVSVSRWPEHKCGGRCFSPVRIAVPPSRADMPRLWPPCSRDSGWIDTSDLDLYAALTASFVETDPEKTGFGSKLRRAVTLFSEAHRAHQEGLTFDDLGPDEPGHRTVLWFVAGLGMAFEALFGREGKRHLAKNGDRQLLGSADCRNPEGLAAFVASSSYFGDLKEVLDSTGQLNAEVDALADAVKARLESGLDAVTAMLRRELVEALRPHLTGMHVEDDVTRLARWFSAFYGLRSRLAHGGEVSESHLYESGLSGGRWHGNTARTVFRAAVATLLANSGYYDRLPSGLLFAKRHVERAVQAVLTKGQRITRAIRMIENEAYANNEHASRLADLLASIGEQDGDDSYSDVQLEELKLALGALERSSAPQYLKWKSSALWPQIELLETLHGIAGMRQDRPIV